MSVTGYYKPGKGKAFDLLTRFCAGAGGKVCDGIPKKLLPGPAAFYGVTPELMHLWNQAKGEGRDWYYIDNAYFDKWREVYFRITRNRLQAHGSLVLPSPARLEALDIKIAPWRKDGSFVLLCPQSEQFMRDIAGYANSWAVNVIEELRQHTQREIRVKSWNRDKMRWYDEFPAAIKGCWCVVTWSSASAISAMIRGVPAIVMAEDCVAREYCTGWLERIETPLMTENRETMLGVAARFQFTRAEMESGYAWKVVNEGN